MAEAKGPLIYISYGMRKSGSTLAFELTRAILELNGFPQKRLSPEAVPSDAAINFVHHLSADQLERIEDEARALGAPIVLKTHVGPTPAVEAWLIASVKIRNVDVPEGVDGRSKLLNMGIQESEGRYLSFLDFDDVLYHNCFELLSKRLSGKAAAVSFASVMSAEAEMVGGQPYVSKKHNPFKGNSVYDLFVDNFCPIHSYLVDKSKISAADLYFDEDLDVLEDYDFLLRITSKYPSDLSLVGAFVGEYRRWKKDTFSLYQTEYVDESTHISKVDYARGVITRRKLGLSITVKISEFAC